ncbi:family 20 glycosylhydrolase [Pedobacter gandavensis]|uniref:family 20 glycosylhydrolase n=1 Tax=Pedobacter gandavensis TaxID=2679963 RepID=UPI00292E5255|nr:family 20 glycosylhydrolase [Pedobacter gandavensis]
MKNYFLAVFFLFSMVSAGIAQESGAISATDLSLNWTQSNAKDGLILAINNNGNSPFPASGWKIYFNSRELKVVAADTLLAKVQLVNGALFRLTPLEGFKALAPGSSIQLHMVTEGMSNQSERPQGFYLVWDHQPEKGIAIKNVTFKPFSTHEMAEQEIAKNTFEENKKIKDIREKDLPMIFPTPLKYYKWKGTFDLTADVKIKAQEGFENEAALLSQEITKVLGKKPAGPVKRNGKEIVFLREPRLSEEAYHLSIDTDKVLIWAASGKGAFYAIQSLKSMFPSNSWSGIKKRIKIPEAYVQDKPRFGFRGFMMDVGRNFQPKSEVLKVLDLMALYKLNVFHFHLTEDEGWRLEIPGLPELTAVGARRGHSLEEDEQIHPAYGSGPIAGLNSGTGFYTKADYIEILKYATARHIRVIPEIETPGHARAAIKAMDARYNRLIKAGDKEGAEYYLLRDLKDESQYRSVQGFDDNVINVALPSSYHFLEKVADELIAMHKEANAPLTTIHFGGDEVPAGVWEKSPAASQLAITDPAVKGTDELWFYFFSKLNKMLQSKSLFLSGWEEIGLRKQNVNGKMKMLPEPRFFKQDFHVDVWNNLHGNEDLAYKMANEGYRVVLSPVTNFYIDLAANKSFEETGQNWGGYVDVDKLFYFIPFDYYRNVKEDEEGNPVDPERYKNKDRLTMYGKSNIIGLQAPLWSENIKTPAQFEYMLLPKLLGLAERAWAKDPEWATEQDPEKGKLLYDQAWSEFINVLAKKELPRLNDYAGGFDYRIPTPGLQISNGQVAANVLFPGFTIRYTTDGTEPELSSKLYTTVIPFKEGLRFRVFNGKNRGGRSIMVKSSADFLAF